MALFAAVDEVSGDLNDYQNLVPLDTSKRNCN